MSKSPDVEGIEPAAAADLSKTISDLICSNNIAKANTLLKRTLEGINWTRRKDMESVFDVFKEATRYPIVSTSVLLLSYLTKAIPGTVAFEYLILERKLHLYLLKIFESNTKTGYHSYQRLFALRFFFSILINHKSQVPEIIIRSFLSYVSVLESRPGELEFKHQAILLLAEISLEQPEVFYRCNGFSSLFALIVQKQILNVPRVFDYLVLYTLYLFSNKKYRRYVTREDLYTLFGPLFAIDFDTKEQYEKFFLSKRIYESYIHTWPGIILLLEDDTIGLRALIKFSKHASIGSKRELIKIFYDIINMRIDADGRCEFQNMRRTSSLVESLKFSNTEILEYYSLTSSKSKSGPKYDVLQTWFTSLDKEIPRSIDQTVKLNDEYLLFLIHTLVNNGLLDFLVCCTKFNDKYLNSYVISIYVSLVEKSNDILPLELFKKVNSFSQFLRGERTQGEDLVIFRVVNMMIENISKRFKQDLASRNYFLASSIANISKLDTVDVPKNLDGTWAPSERYFKYANINRLSKLVSEITMLSKATPSNSTKIKSNIFEETNVLKYPENWNRWNFEKIYLTLGQHPSKVLITQKKEFLEFLKHLMRFFSPTGFVASDGRWLIGFPLIPLEKRTQFYVRVGLQMVNLLPKCDDPDVMELFESFANDLSRAILTSLNHSLLSLHELDAKKTMLVTEVVSRRYTENTRVMDQDSVSSTLSGEYFMVLGRYTSFKKGTQILRKAGLFDVYSSMCNFPQNTQLIVRMIKSLDYSQSSNKTFNYFSILSTLLLHGHPDEQRFCLQHLKLLFRVHTKNFFLYGLDTIFQYLSRDLSSEPKELVRGMIDLLVECLCRSKVYFSSTLESLDFNQPLYEVLKDEQEFLGHFIKHRSGLGFFMEKRRRYKRLMAQAKAYLEEGHIAHFRSINKRFIEVLSTKSSSEVLYRPNVISGLLNTDAGLDELVNNLDFLSFIRGKMELFVKDPESLESLAFLWLVGCIGTTDNGFKILKDEKILDTLEDLSSGGLSPGGMGVLYFVRGLWALSVDGRAYLVRRGFKFPVNPKRVGCAIPPKSHWDYYAKSFALNPAPVSIPTSRWSEIIERHGLTSQEVKVFERVSDLTNEILKPAAIVKLKKYKKKQKPGYLTEKLYLVILEELFSTLEIDFDTRVFIHWIFH